MYRSLRARTRKPKTVVQQSSFLELPHELQREIFSYIPTDMHVTLRMPRTDRTKTLHSGPARRIEGLELYEEIVVVLLNGKEWQEIEGIFSVSRRFYDLMNKAIAWAAKMKNISIIMDLRNSDRSELEDERNLRGFHPGLIQESASRTIEARDNWLNIFETLTIISPFGVRRDVSPLHVSQGFSMSVVTTKINLADVTNGPSFASVSSKWDDVAGPLEYTGAMLCAETFDDIVTTIHDPNSRGGLPVGIFSKAQLCDLHHLSCEIVPWEGKGNVCNMARGLLTYPMFVKIKQARQDRKDMRDSMRMKLGWHGVAAERANWFDMKVKGECWSKAMQLNEC